MGAFSATCPSCGYELRNRNAADSIRNFSKKIEQADSEEQKTILIRNFPVANTKEDIIEFMILASSNISGENSETVFHAWLSKFEQCYQKAKLTFGNDPDFIEMQNLHEQTIKRSNKERFLHSVNKGGSVISKLASTIPNPIVGLVVVLLVIWEITRIIGGDFVGADIILVVLIIWWVYKITVTNKGDKKQ